MKRKFFSVMAAACVALFSLSGLTGCSGGDDEDATYGIVTLNDFAKGRKGFKVSLGLGEFSVMPDTSVAADRIELKLPDDIEDNPYSTGKVVRQCIVNNKYKATVVYNLPSWTANNEFPTDGDGADPNNTTSLVVTFVEDSVAPGAVDDDLLLSLGAYPSKDSLVTSLRIGLQYSAYGCNGSYAVVYMKGNDMTKTEMSTTGYFFVSKN